MSERGKIKDALCEGKIECRKWCLALVAAMLVLLIVSASGLAATDIVIEVYEQDTLISINSTNATLNNTNQDNLVEYRVYNFTANHPDYNFTINGLYATKILHLFTSNNTEWVQEDSLLGEKWLIRTDANGTKDSSNADGSCAWGSCNITGGSSINTTIMIITGQPDPYFDNVTLTAGLKGNGTVNIYVNGQLIGEAIANDTYDNITLNVIPKYINQGLNTITFNNTGNHNLTIDYVELSVVYYPNQLNFTYDLVAGNEYFFAVSEGYLLSITKNQTHVIPSYTITLEYGDGEFKSIRVPLISEEDIEVTTDFTLVGGLITNVVNISIQLTTIAGQNISILNDTLTFDEYRANRSEYIFEQPSESGIYSLYATDMYEITEKVSEFIAPYYIEDREHTRKITPAMVVLEYGVDEFGMLRVPLISEEGIEVTTDFTLVGGLITDVVNISIQLTTVLGQNISILNDTLTFDEYRANRSEYIFEQPSESGKYSLYVTDMYGITEKVSEFISPYHIQNREHTRKIAPSTHINVKYGDGDFKSSRVPLISEEGIEVTTNFTLVGGLVTNVVDISIQLTTIAGQNISILNDTLTFDECRINHSTHVFEQPSESGIYSLYLTNMSSGVKTKVSEFIAPYYIENREHTRKIAPAVVVQEYGIDEFGILRVPLISEEGIEVTTDFTLVGGNSSRDVVNISIQLTTIAGQNISILNDTLTFDEYRVNRSEYIFEQPSESGKYSLYATDMYGATEKVSEFIAPYYIENREHTRKIASALVVQEYGIDEFGILRVPLISEEGIEVTTDFTLVGGNSSIDVVNISIELTTVAGQNISILNDTLTFDEYRVNRSEYIFEQPSESGKYSLYATDMYGLTEKVSEFIVPYYIQNREHTRKIAPALIVQEKLIITLNLNVSAVNPEGSVEVSGKAMLQVGETNITNTNVSIWVDSGFQKNCTTDSYGIYACNIIAPSELGTHTLKVNLTDGNGHYAENSITFEVSELEIGNWVINDSHGESDAMLNSMEKFNVSIWLREYNGSRYFNVTSGSFDVRINETGFYGNLSYVSGAVWKSEFIAPSLCGVYTIVVNGTSNNGVYGTNFTTFTILANFNVTLQNFNGEAVNDSLVTVTDTQGATVCFGNTNPGGKLSCSADEAQEYNVNTTYGVYAYNLSAPNDLILLYYPSMAPIGNLSVTFLDENGAIIPNAAVSICEAGSMIQACSGYTNSRGMLECGLNSSKNYDLNTRFGTHRQSVSMDDVNISIGVTTENWRDTFNSDSGLHDNIGVSGKENIIVSNGDVKIDNVMLLSANFTSVTINPSQIVSWDRIWITDTVDTAEANITYSILDADNNTLLDIKNGNEISSIVNTSIRLFANFTTINASYTPVLHEWNISWAKEMRYTEFRAKCLTTDLDDIGFFDVNISLILDDCVNAKIEWKEDVTLNSTYNLDNAVDFTKGKVSVNSLMYPSLNKTASITMYNLNFGAVKIQKDGSECPSSICQNLSYNNMNGLLTFDVTGFTEYEAVEANQSKISNNNTNSLDTRIYLLMKVQWYNGSCGEWIDDDLVYNSTEPMNLSAGSILKLDQYFNEKWKTTNASYGDGTYRIYASIIEENNLVLENIDGTWLNATFEFTIDTTKPTVILNNPDNDTITNMTSINFNWTATDNSDSNSTCNLTIDGVVNKDNINSPNNTATNYIVTGFADGVHCWNVTCWDDGNNANTSETWMFEVDTGPPSVTLVSPMNYYTTSILKINFTFNTTDRLAGIQNCSLIINNSLTAYNESTINRTYTTFLDVSVGDGSNQNWTVNCSNGVNTDQPEVRYFLVDSIPPIITIQSPENKTYLSKVWFNVTLNENASWCGYSLETTANVSMDGTGTEWYKENSSMTDGSHNVDFYCNDTYGNMNSSAITLYFTVDTTEPQYSNNQTNSSEAGSYVLFRLYWEDNVALAGYIFSFDNGTGTFVNDSYTEMSGTENWSNATKRVNSTVGTTIRWRVYANDTTGNMNASGEYVYLTIAIPPKYFNITAIPPVGILGNESSFSVDWTDGTALDTCIFSHTFEPTVLEIQEQNMSNRKTGFGSTRYRAQSLIPNTSGYIIRASVYLDYQAGTRGDIVYEIRTNDINRPGSTVLGQANIPAVLLTTAGWYTANFSTPIPVSMGVTYWITVSSPTASSNNVYRIHYTSTDTYSEGYMAYSFDSGARWTTQTTYDVRFRLETAEFNYKNETESLTGNSDTCTKTLAPQYNFVGYWYQCANDSINGLNCTQEQTYQVTQAEDTESPAGELISPVNNSNMNGNVTILATVSDNVGLDYAYFQWRNSSDPWTNLTGCMTDCLSLPTYNPTCTWITSGFDNTTEGYEIRVIPVDLSGNENTSAIPFTYIIDRINPFVENVTTTYPPGQSHVTNGQTVTLSLSARDPPDTGAGINITETNLSYLNGSGDTEMVFVSGSKEAGLWSDWELNVTLSGAITGTRIAAISVYDNSTPTNNVATGDIFIVNVDTHPPQHFDISRDAGPIYLNATVSYQVRWTDNIDLEYYIFSSNITGIWANDSLKKLTGAENWSVVTKDMINNGTVGWRIYAFDHVNNSNDTGIQYVTVLSELIPNPVVSLIGPLSDTVTTNTTIDFTYNITNLTDSQLDACELYLDWMLNTSDNTLLINDTMNFTVEEITEGYHEWYIQCNNTNNGLGMTDTWNFTIDLTSPTITIDSPKNDTYAQTQVWFNITLDEAGSWCGYSLDSVANVTMTNYSGNWNSQNPPVADGSHNVTFSCNDTVGNMNASAITGYFTVDTPPTTTLISPADNYNTSSTTVDFTFSVVDKLNTLMICSLYINGTLRTTNTSTFNATETTFSSIGVSSSLNQNWTVNCSDGINLHMPSSRIFNVDMTSPSFSNYKKEPASPTEEQNVQVNVTLSETPDTVILELNGTANYTITTNSGLEYYFMIVNGTNFTAHDTITYYWYANDSAGNLNKSLQQSFTVSNQNPGISVTEPVGGNDNTTSMFTVAWTASDFDDEDVLNVSCYGDVDNTDYDIIYACFSMVANSGSWLCDMSGWASDEYYIWCNVTDHYVNVSGYSSGNIMVDNDAPDSTHPDNVSYTRNTVHTIAWSLTDNFAPGYYYVTRNGTLQNESSIWTNNTAINVWLNTSAVGDWNYTIFYNDSLGTAGVSDEVIVTVTKIVLPIITIQYPSNTSYSQKWIWANVTLDKDAGWCGVSLNGTANQTMLNNSPVSWYTNLTVPSEGPNNVKFYCNDTIGYIVNSSIVYFAIDTILPSIQITLPQNTTYNTYPQLNFSFVEDNPDTCWYSLNSGANSTISGCLNGTVLTSSYGSNSVIFYMNDSAGNENFTQQYFTYDNIGPIYTGNLTSPASPVTYSPSLSVEFNITMSDDYSSVSTVFLEFNGTNYTTTNISSVYVKTLSGLAAGNYNYRWHMNDSLGNVNSTSVMSYIVNKAAATLTLLLNGTDSDKMYYTPASLNATYTVNNNEVSVNMYRNSTALTLTGNTNISIYTLAGAWNYSVSTAGSQNYTSTSAWHLVTILETPAPNITVWQNNITGDQSLSVTLNETQSIFFNITVSQPVNYSWSLDDVDHSRNAPDWTYSGASAGSRSVKVNVSNENGTDTLTWTLTVKEIPNINSVQESIDPVSVNSVISIEANITDLDNDLEGKYAVIDNIWYEMQPNGQDRYLANFTPTMEKVYYYYVYANDTTGLSANTSTDTFTAQQSPVIVNVSVRPSSGNETTDFVITANVTDFNGVDKVYAKFTQPTVFEIELTNETLDIYNVTYNSTTPGMYVFNVWSNDTIGTSSSSSSCSFTINDTIPPTINTVSIMPQEKNETTIINIEVNVTDFNLSTVYANITGPKDSIRVLTGSNPYSNNTGPIPHTPGFYNVTITAIDASGNNETFTTNYTINDTQAPQLKSLTVIPALGNVNTNFTITANITDNDAVNSSYANITKPDNTYDILTLTGANPYTVNTTNTSLLGLYRVSIIANDSAGNTFHSAQYPLGTANFSIADTGPPAINELNITASVNTTQIVTISANVTDDNAVNFVNATITRPDTYQIPLATFTNTSDIYTANFTETAIPGFYTVSFTAVDIAGNSSTETSNFTANDTTSPQITLFSVDDDTPALSQQISFTITSSDNDIINKTTGALNITKPDNTSVLIPVTEISSFTQGSPPATVIVQGNAQYTPGATGNYTAVLTITDLANNTVQSNLTFKASDATGPVLDSITISAVECRNIIINITTDEQSNYTFAYDAGAGWNYASNSTFSQNHTITLPKYSANTNIIYYINLTDVSNNAGRYPTIGIRNFTVEGLLEFNQSHIELNLTEKESKTIQIRLTNPSSIAIDATLNKTRSWTTIQASQYLNPLQTATINITLTPDDSTTGNWHINEKITAHGSAQATFFINMTVFRRCGDNECDSGETCSSCPADCGICAGDTTTSSSGGGSSGGGAPILPPQHECENNSACKGTQTCKDYKCIDLECAYCEYAKDHECKKYKCCKDTDCKDGWVCEDHKCIKAKEQNETTILDIKEAARRAISTARNFILRQRLNKDTSKSEAVLREAESAYDKENYEKAIELAQSAKLLAENAPLREKEEQPGEDRFNWVLALGLLLLLIVLAALYVKRDAVRTVVGKYTLKAPQWHKIRELEDYLDMVRPIITNMKYKEFEAKLLEIEEMKDEAEKMLKDNNSHANEQIQVTVDALIELRKEVESGAKENK